MASPFYLFRKYQKTFLVIAGVLAMFIFVVADPLMSWLQSSGGGSRNAATVVATWDGGSLNLQQLDSLAQRRYKISDFLRNLWGVGAGMIEQEGGTPELPTLPDFRLRQGTEPRAVQIGCITTRVLAELAKKSDISVSDDVVNHYLREWGLRRLGDAKIASILGRIGLNDKTLFAGLRELLMGNFYINSYIMAIKGVTPEERWQDWKRINERIAIEAGILPAEKFVSEVPEPSDTELQQFFDLHKERVADIPQMVLGARLPSPDPGFREPRRVRLQYLLGSIDDWTQKSLETVTEEQIADYYERNKRTQFVKTSSSLSAGGIFDDDDVDSNSAEEKSDEETSDSETSDPESTEETPSSEESETSEPETESPADEDSGRLLNNSPFRLAAFQEDAEGETASDVDGDVEATEAEAEPTDTNDEESPEYEPLANVQDQIRRTLATEKAVVELQRAVDRTYTSLQSAYNPYGFKVVSARTEAKEIPAPPTTLSDYIAIAKETGLASEETVLLTALELSETFVGKAFDAQSRSEFVVQAMFGDQELYEPYRATDLDGNSYIVCKVEDVPSRVPEFDEVRDAVMTAWKKQEAAKLALAKAEELAKQAEASGDTVATVIRSAGYETVTTDLFSWLTFGTTPQEMQRGPRLGDAPPLQAINDKNMVTMFGLKPDKKVAMLNHDQSNAYVIQLDRREQSEAQLREQFLKEANSWYGGRVMNSVRAGSSQRQLLGELTNRAGLNVEKIQELMSE